MTIPFFPEYLANLSADIDYNGSRLSIRSRFAGRQEAELLNIDQLSVDPYALVSLDLSHSFDQFFGLGRLTLSGKIENLFNKKYLTSGYGGDYAYEDTNVVYAGGWAEYYPGAERSFYGQVRLELF